MDNDYLTLLRDAAIELIKECKDEDLLDLLCKLLVQQTPLQPRSNSKSRPVTRTAEGRQP